MATKTKTIANRRDEERSILEHMGDDLDDAKGRLAQLWDIHETKYGTDGEYLCDGSFTDAGRKRLRQLFESGKRNMEIAEFFGVTDAAVAYQRKRWMQLQGSLDVK